MVNGFAIIESALNYFKLIIDSIISTVGNVELRYLHWPYRNQLVWTFRSTALLSFPGIRLQESTESCDCLPITQYYATQMYPLGL